jgi:predicted transposase YbfD/YdcC
MVEFGKQRLEWLQMKLDLANGIPSHDTFNRVFQIIDPAHFSEVLKEDGAILLDHIEGKLICFDGKKMRGVSPKSRGNKGLYILNAWVAENRLCIGQKKVGDKSNEITAIPELLEELELKDSTVSIDAIGCQKNIAAQIVKKEADYLLAVKGNQADLQEEVSESFQYSKVEQMAEQWEYDHGRYETRQCQILRAELVLSPNLKADWPSIKTLIKIESTRDVKGVKSTETRYYISSHDKRSAEQYNNMVRGHWGIENHLHWHLDVTFREDANRSRKGNAPQNLNILRKMALHRIARDNIKISMKKRRFRASMNIEYLEKSLNL